MYTREEVSRIAAVLQEVTRTGEIFDDDPELRQLAERLATEPGNLYAASEAGGIYGSSETSQFPGFARTPEEGST